MARPSDKNPVIFLSDARLKREIVRYARARRTTLADAVRIAWSHYWQERGLTETERLEAAESS